MARARELKPRCNGPVLVAARSNTDRGKAVFALDTTRLVIVSIKLAYPTPIFYGLTSAERARFQFAAINVIHFRISLYRANCPTSGCISRRTRGRSRWSVARTAASVWCSRHASRQHSSTSFMFTRSMRPSSRGTGAQSAHPTDARAPESRPGRECLCAGGRLWQMRPGCR